MYASLKESLVFSVYTVKIKRALFAFVLYCSNDGEKEVKKAPAREIDSG